MWLYQGVAGVGGYVRAYCEVKHVLKRICSTQDESAVG